MDTSTAEHAPPERPETPAVAAGSAAPRLAGMRAAVTMVGLTLTGVVGLGGFVGADARWLAALGSYITRSGSVPTGVPFAAAPSGHWHNAVVLAQLTFHWLEAAAGDRGLMIAQIVAVGIAVVIMMYDARAAGASPQGAGTAVLIAAIGSVGSLVIARVQLFSIVLFPALLALLRSETRRPSWRLWLAVPLIAVWSNLHGAVLLGVGVLFVYLVFSRARENLRTRVGVALATLVAVCLTPAGLGTISYYHGLLTNQAAARGQGLWAPLSLSSGLDLLLVLAVLALAYQLRRRRPPLWELVAIVLLAIETVQAARSGLWLALLLAVPAAPSLRDRRWWAWLMPPVAALAAIGLVAAVVRGPLANGAGPALVDRALTLAHGSPILADDVIDEQVALAGGRIWAGNPIDAFAKPDQIAYLDWVAGDPGGSAAVGSQIKVAITARSDGAQKLMSRDRAFVEVASDKGAVLFARRP
jgi:hypothetical protein